MRHRDIVRHEAWQNQPDHAVIVGMRAGVAAAFEEFVARYEPLLLARARRTALSEWEQHDCVADVLETVALHLLRPGVRAPAEIAAYLARALHNRLVDIARTQASRVANESRAADRSSPSVDGVVTSLCSQFAVEACDQPALQNGGTALSPALRTLAAVLCHALNREERLLLEWEGNMIPHRTIAEWIGITHAAASKRISRLRTRLRMLAAEYVAGVEPLERLELSSFMTRQASRPQGDQHPVAMVAEQVRDSYRAATDSA